MNLTIDKDKLPKGSSYVLKTSVLQKVIEESGVDLNINLIYCGPPSKMPIFEVHFWLPNANVSYDRFYIRTGFVQSKHRKKISDLVNLIVLPEFIKWASYLVNLPINSTERKQELMFVAEYYEQTGLTINES